MTARTWSRGLLPALAVVAILPLAAACGGQATGAISDCVTATRDIAGDVAQLQHALATSGSDPRGAGTAVRTIQSRIDDIAGGPHVSPATSAALGRLNTAVDTIKDDLDNGVRPDMTPVTAAASALAQTCVAHSSAAY